MSSNETQAEKPTGDLKTAVRNACQRKLERAISPTTTIRARDVKRMGVDWDMPRIARCLETLEREKTVEELGISITVEPNRGEHRTRYRLAEADRDA